MNHPLSSAFPATALAIVLTTAIGAGLAASAHAAGVVRRPGNYPFRCSQQGICTDAVETASLIGACRHADDELKFHALYRPAGDENDSKAGGTADGNNYCVTFNSPEGELIWSSGNSTACSDTASAFKTADEGAKEVRGKLSPATIGCLDHILFAQPLTAMPNAWAEIKRAAAEALELNEADSDGADDGSPESGDDAAAED